MYRYEDIRHVHFEPTTRCNAQCPMCARNARGLTAPGLDLVEQTIEDVRCIFPNDFLAQLTGFDLCGAYGDPAIARDLLEIVASIRAAGPTCKINVFTNGGARSVQFWQQLAEVLGEHGCVVFAIDGLRDTNHIYRRGVNFDRVITNARAFIRSGGDAQWDFIVFRHNEHQIAEARRLSEQLGFRQFAIKKTARFLKPVYDYVPEVDSTESLEQFPIYSPEGERIGSLEPPKDTSLVNETARRYTERIDGRGSLDSVLSSTHIHCQVMDTRSVFVGAQGSVFPCCWTYVQATSPKLYGFPAAADRQVYELVERLGGFERIDARRVGLRKAIESPLFDAIEASWRCSAVAAGRLKVCARVCGTDFPAYLDQFAAPDLVPGQS
jgi:MoaA/NifB/PqqE/SkfB family radical SAM enzyme